MAHKHMGLKKYKNHYIIQRTAGHAPVKLENLQEIEQ